MKTIGFGRTRVIAYCIWGAAAGALLAGAHLLLDLYARPYHYWILLVLIPALGAGMALLARRENDVYEWGSKMDAARNRVNDLMREAVARKQWVPAFQSPDLATCWRELGCGQEDCPAYGQEHARCWLIAGTFCRGEVQGKFAKKLEDCRLCPVFRKANRDPVREMTENFYAMTYLLGEREEQLEKAYQEARSRSEKLAGLVALSEAALSSFHLNELLQNLLVSAASFAGADMGCVSLADGSGENLVARVTYGLAPGAAGKLTERVGEGILGRAFAGTYIAVSEDLSVDSRFVSPYLKSLQVKTLISLPLVGRGQPLGMLTLGTFTPHHYSEEEKDSLCVAADRIAAAVENTQLESELSRDRTQVELMTALTQDLSSNEGMAAIYESFTGHIRKLIDFDRASLSLWHPESQEVEFVATNTKAERTWLDRGLWLPREALPIGKAIESYRPLVRDDIRGDEYPADKLLVEEGIRSEVIIPLISKGEVLGTVNLGSFHAGAFSPADLELLEPAVRQLGLVIDNARLMEETRRHSLTDGLTGLYSHRFFYEAVSSEVERAEKHVQPVSILIMDVDDFKEYNDVNGHPEGDQVLRVIAQTLRASVRQFDIVARYGGDEFALLLPDMGVSEPGEETDARRTAERIREMLAANSFLIEKGKITVSIGVAEWPSLARDANQMFERAGWALREAKSRGKNQVVVAGRLGFDKGPGPDSGSGGAGIGSGL